MKWPRRLVVGLLAASLVLVAAHPASAHEPGTSAVDMTLTATGLDIRIEAPLAELSEALGLDLPSDAFGLSQTREPIVVYLLNNLSITTQDGEPLPLTAQRLTVVQIDGIEFLRVDIEADGVASGSVAFNDRMILENDDSHQIIVTVTEPGGGAEIAGVIDADSPQLMISLTEDGYVESGTGAGFVETMRYGFDHVLDGADHLLFLLTLLLPAPLVAVHRRWQASSGVWPALKKVVHVATAFTVGHSVSLAASAFGVVSAPVRVVEILIGVSVGVSAVHAIRPLAPRGEIPIAAGFGLIHGLAFAEILNNFALDEANMLRTLLGFNLGVELAQLVTISFVFPSLWLLSRTRFYPAVRIAGAGFALALSVAWVVERLELAPNPLAPIEDRAIANLLLVATVLTALGVACRLGGRSAESLPGE